MIAVASRLANSSSLTIVFCSERPIEHHNVGRVRALVRCPELGPPCCEDVHEPGCGDAPVEGLPALHRGLHVGPLPAAAIDVDLAVGHGHAGRPDPRAPAPFGLCSRVGPGTWPRTPQAPATTARPGPPVAGRPRRTPRPERRPAPASGRPTGPSWSSPIPGFPQPAAGDPRTHRGAPRIRRALETCTQRPSLLTGAARERCGCRVSPRILVSAISRQPKGAS